MKPESTELVPAQGAHLAERAPASLAVSEAPSLTQMLSAVIQGGVTADNVGVLKEMLAIHERMEMRNAEKDFNSAFVRLQNDLPVIVASSIIPNRGRYERFEDVMHVVGPLLARHGFSVSFSMENENARVTETCTLRHIAGHSQSNKFSVRTGRADTETQADCKAATTAKRNALLNCLNIVIRQDALLDEDQDASIEGAFISPDKAIYLRELVKSTKSNEVAFLAFAQATKYEEITVSRYDRLVAQLQKKAGAS